MTETLAEAQNLLVQGKRYMALEDYQAATDVLEQAVQLFDANFGVAKIECADAYLEYGLALVALANVEAGSGTDKIMKKAGIEEEDGDEGEEGDDEEAEDEEGSENENDKDGNGEDEKMEEETQKEEKTNGNQCMEASPKSTKTNGVSAGGSTVDEPQASSSSARDPTPGTSGTNDEETVENEEATTIEIAWEVLCLAKRLFMTDESLDGRMKLAETLQKLGEISIEWDNNDNAVSILEECLNIRKAILSPEDRLIALTYYNLGLAHSFKNDTPKANENFQNAINVIEKRIDILGKQLAEAKEKQDTATVSRCEKEVNELKELLPDMTMRMDDTKDEESNEVLKRTRDELEKEDEEVQKVCLDRSKPVDDISHLVKRKAT